MLFISPPSAPPTTPPLSVSSLFIYMHLYVHIYAYMCMCLCERERESAVMPCTYGVVQQLPLAHVSLSRVHPFLVFPLLRALCWLC